MGEWTPLVYKLGSRIVLSVAAVGIRGISLDRHQKPPKEPASRAPHMGHVVYSVSCCYKSLVLFSLDDYLPFFPPVERTVKSPVRFSIKI